MLCKLATQSFNILRLIARNPNFLRPKVPYFNASRLSRLQMAQNDPKWPKMALEWPKMISSGPKMTQNGPQLPLMAQKWARALWANLSLSRARSELRDWLTRPLLGSERRSSAPTLYATLVNGPTQLICISDLYFVEKNSRRADLRCMCRTSPAVHCD